MKFVLLVRCLLFAVLLLLTSCNVDNGFNIDVNIKQVTASKAFLININDISNTITILDSSEIKDGRFSFSGHVDYPQACRIKVGNKTTIYLLVENSNIRVTGSVKMPEEIKVVGSKADSDFQYLVTKYKRCQIEKNKIWSSLSECKSDSIESKLKCIDDSMLSEVNKYVESHRKSYGAAYFVYYLYVDKLFDIDKLGPTIALFSDDLEGSFYLDFLKGELELAKPLLVGDVAPGIERTQLNGKQFSTKDFMGRYYVVDFTASWLKNYNKRLDIMSDLSLRRKVDFVIFHLDLNSNGLARIMSDTLPGLHGVCSYECWETPETKNFSVNKIPMSYVVSPDKKVCFISDDINGIEKYVDSVLSVRKQSTD